MATSTLESRPRYHKIVTLLRRLEYDPRDSPFCFYRSLTASHALPATSSWIEALVLSLHVLHSPPKKSYVYNLI